MLLLAAFAIPAIAEALVRASAPGLPRPGWQDFALVIRYGFQLLVGLALLFGRRGLSRFMTWVRTAGLPTPDGEA